MKYNEGISDGALFCNRFSDFRFWARDLGCTVFRSVHLGVRRVWMFGTLGIADVAAQSLRSSSGQELLGYRAAFLLHGRASFATDPKPHALGEYSSRFVFHADFHPPAHGNENNLWGCGFHFGSSAWYLFENQASARIGGVATGVLICSHLPLMLEHFDKLCCVTGDCEFDLDRGAISVRKAGVSYLLGKGALASHPVDLVA